jgi:hypothetical protein
MLQEFNQLLSPLRSVNNDDNLTGYGNFHPMVIKHILKSMSDFSILKPIATSTPIYGDENNRRNNCFEEEEDEDDGFHDDEVFV